MAQATVLGSLLVQLGMDSAQFERASQKAQSTVNKMAAGIGVSAKDVVAASNRMGVSVTAFAGQVASLQQRLNPGNQALANYRREMGLLREALRIGAISQQQFRGSVQASLATYRAAGAANDNLRKTTGSAQAGMQQLGFQINDIATQFASGTKPMQIFGQQAGQVVQSIQLMTGGAGKFGAFMAGPWGIAVTAGIVVLSSFVGKLFETEKALEKVEFASSAMGDAQSILGGIVDLTTGKINTQSKALIGLARAQAVAGQIQSRARAAEARSELAKGRNDFGGSMNQALVDNGRRGGTLGGGGAGGTQTQRSPSAGVANDVLNGKLDTNSAIKRLDALREAGKITEKQFLELGKSITALGVETENQKIYENLEKAVNGDKSAIAGFLDPKKPKKPKKGKDQDKIAARYDEDINRLQSERAQLQADYNKDIDSQYKAEIVAIDNDLASFKSNTLANKDIGGARQQALILEATKNAEIKRQIAESERNSAMAERSSEIYEKDLDLQIQQVQLRGQLALSTRDQRDADLEMLDLQDRLKIAQLDRIMATEASSSAAWQNAYSEKQALQASAGQRRQAVERQHMSPMEQYRYNQQVAVANINDAMENIQVSAMQNLNDGIAGAIAGTQKLGDVFKNVAQQIVADLIRIQIQKAVVGSLGNLLSFGGSAINGITGSGFAKGLGSEIAGWAANTNVSIPAYAGGTNFHIGGLAMVGERGPELVNMPRGSQVIPNHELGNMRSVVEIVDTTGLFVTRVNGQIMQAAPGIASAGGNMGSNGAQVAIARKQSRSIP